MSWWDTGEGTDVIGDQPADVLGHVLRRIAEERAQQSRQKPTLSELLRALGTVASEARGKQLEDVPESLREIVAHLGSGVTVSSGPLGDDRDNRDLAAEIRAGLDAVADIYRSRWERNPRLSEWLECFTFVLGYRPEQYLQDGSSRAPVKIVAL